MIASTQTTNVPDSSQHDFDCWIQTAATLEKLMDKLSEMLPLWEILHSCAKFSVCCCCYESSRDVCWRRHSFHYIIIYSMQAPLHALRKARAPSRDRHVTTISRRVIRSCESGRRGGTPHDDSTWQGRPGPRGGGGRGSQQWHVHDSTRPSRLRTQGWGSPTTIHTWLHKAVLAYSRA